MIRSNPARRLAAVLLSALVLQASGVGRLSSAAFAAEPAASVVVLPVKGMEGVSEATAARFRELLISELKSREGVQPILPSSSSPSIAPSSTEALDDIQKGQKSLADLRFDAAATALKAGIAAMVKQPESIDWKTLIGAYVSLAVASFRSGDEDGAQKALMAVARLAPDYKLPDGQYPPIFVREHEKARRRADKGVRGSVSVEGPPGSTAFVNGEDLGMVPVLQENLSAGVHYVKVEGTRGELFGAAVEVKGGVAKVTARFAPASAPATAHAAIGPRIDAADLKTLASACEAAGASFAVAGILYRTGDHQLTAGLALYSAQHRALTALAPRAFDHELLTANVEAYKLVDEIADATGQFPRAASLPLDLVTSPERRASAPVVRKEEDLALVAPPARRTLVPREEPVGEGEQVRVLGGQSVTAEAAGSGEPQDGAVRAGGTAWWIWALVGVGVAAAAGGTYYGVSQAARPVTGTVTASW